MGRHVVPPLSDCDLNAGLAPTAQRLCSQYIVLGDSEDQEFKSNVKKFSQNNIDLFVGSMKVSEILSVAMIPDLEFAQGNHQFAEYTHEQIGRLPTVPTRWQRPLELSIEKKIRNYFIKIYQLVIIIWIILGTTLPKVLQAIIN